MAGTKKYNANIDVRGTIQASDVPNSTGTFVTWNAGNRIFGTRTNAQIIADLGLATQAWANTQGWITMGSIGNGNITYTGTGSITGGGTSTANQSGNTNYLFDLTASTKSDINQGVTAFGWGRGLRVDGNGQFAGGGTIAGTIDAVRNASMYASSSATDKPGGLTNQDVTIVNFTSGNANIGGIQRYSGFDVVSSATTDQMWFRRENLAAGKLTWLEFIHSGNIGNYLPSATDYWTTNTTQTGLTGNKTTSGIITSSGGFVGSLTGNATTATTLATARTINGTSFNGSANITTALWGTARNITIGNTTKSVNGSANVSWSLTEIGASSVSHTHPISDIIGLQTALDSKANVNGSNVVANSVWDIDATQWGGNRFINSLGGVPNYLIGAYSNGEAKFVDATSLNSFLGINTSWNLQQVTNNGASTTHALDIQTTTYAGGSIFNSGDFAFQTHGGSALRVLTGGLLASDSYADASLIPAEGIYSKGNIRTAETVHIGAGLFFDRPSEIQDWSVYQNNGGINFYVAGGSIQGDVFKIAENGRLTTLLDGTSADWNAKVSQSQLNDYVNRTYVNQTIYGIKEFHTEYSPTYTSDGLFDYSNISTQLRVKTFSGQILFGYKDYGTGQYFPRIGFDSTNNVKWDLGIGFNQEFTIGKNNDGNILFSINGSGTIGTASHGTSADWKQAFDWGDYRQWGLGNLSPNANINIDNTRESGFYAIYHGTTSGSIPFGYGTLLHTNFGNNEFSQLAIQQGAEQIKYRIKDGSGNVRNWVTLWDSLNLSDPATQTWVTNNFASNTTLGNYVNKAGDTMSGRLGIKTGSLGNNVSLASSVLRVLNNDQGIFMGSFNGTPDYGSWIQSTREAFDIPFNLCLNPSGGNVGIGTTNPQAKLHVNGNAIVANANAPNHAVAFGQLANYALLSQVPTNVSQLVNDANYTTLPLVQAWVGTQGFSTQIPNNGTFTVQGTGALTGNGSTSADAIANTSATLDLTTATKNDITAGKNASTQVTSLFADAVEYFRYHDMSGGGFVDTNEAFFNLVNPTTVSGLAIDISDHHIRGARLVLQGVTGMGGIVTYKGRFIMRNHTLLGTLVIEGQIDQEFVWDANVSRWRQVF